MHKCISKIVLDELGGEKKGYSIKSLGIGDGKEYRFEGMYYEKSLDITIFYNDRPISGIGFKFITTNYKQNSNNYFENMLGETANIRRKDFIYGQVLVFKHMMPYYSSDEKTFTKIEHINAENIRKYLKLKYDDGAPLYHRPDIMFISFIETGDESEFKKIVDSYSAGSPIKINKLEFHKALVEKVNVSFIAPAQTKKSDFDNEMIDFLNKISHFDRFIEAFVNMTKAKTYGR